MSPMLDRHRFVDALSGQGGSALQDLGMPAAARATGGNSECYA